MSVAQGPRNVRACVIGLPALLDDVVRTTLSSAGVELVSDLAALSVDRDPRHDAVVITSRDLSRFEELLRTDAATAILSVAESGRGATLWELWPNERTLGELSASLLVSTVASITPFHARLAAGTRGA